MGQLELTSTAFLSKYSEDRKSFLCMHKPTFGDRCHYQALSLPKGMMFLDCPTTTTHEAMPGSFAASLVGGILFGAAGARLARLATETRSTQIAESYRMSTDEELIQVCRDRKKSFVLWFDEVRWLSIDPPGWCSSGCARLCFEAENVGKYEMEFPTAEDVLSATDLFQLKLPGCTQINVQWNRQTLTIEKRR